MADVSPAAAMLAEGVAELDEVRLELELVDRLDVIVKTPCVEVVLGVRDEVVERVVG